MHEPVTKPSVQFFEKQFQEQVVNENFALNPFEIAILPHVSGSVLDLGCGLGNLSVVAARGGSRVQAIDGSESAVKALNVRARRESLDLHAIVSDLESATISEHYDSVVCIGLLMFFAPPAAFRWVDQIKAATKPGGVAAVNVLVEGTTYLDMFNPLSYTLFGETALDHAFAGWDVLHSDISKFDAPGGTIKRFATIIARRPSC